jgi:hypothetical protein
VRFPKLELEGHQACKKVVALPIILILLHLCHDDLPPGYALRTHHSPDMSVVSHYQIPGLPYIFASAESAKLSSEHQIALSGSKRDCPDGSADPSIHLV